MESSNWAKGRRPTRPQPLDQALRRRHESIEVKAVASKSTPDPAVAIGPGTCLLYTSDAADDM
eukprot:9778413-Karenia_brevis.AAC.1